MASHEPAPADEGAPRLVRLPSFADPRGLLSVAELGGSLPFAAARYFLIRDVPAGAVRARHAQRHGHELLSCVAGACTVEARWGEERATHRLADPASALYLPPGVWVECREFTAAARLLVLCSDPYDPDDQVPDLNELLSEPGG
jgi:dTDP-4-dehydrorhamnose 3,5-epimerase-like enzyme